MAFISKVKKTGKYRICYSLDGISQRSFMLPTGDAKKAGNICSFIDRILAQRKSGEPDLLLSNWLATLTPDLRRRLEKADLLETRQEPKTIRDIIDRFKNRKDVEPATILTYDKIASNLTEYFSSACQLESIDTEQATAFQSWLNKKYCEATAKRRISLAKQYFNEAEKLGWVSKSPFRFCKGGDVVNKTKWQYFSADDIAKAIGEMTNKEHRAQVALMRYAGVRGASEMYQMDWTPETVRWSSGGETGSLTIISDKTKRHKGKESRNIPLHPVLEACLRDLYDAAPEGRLKVFPKLYKTSNPGSWLKKSLRFAGINIEQVYSLRRSYCSDVMEACGQDAKSYESLTGHSFAMGLRHYQLFHRARKEKAEGLLMGFWKVQEVAESSDAGNTGIIGKMVAGFAAEQNAKEPGKQGLNSAENIAGFIAGQGGATSSGNGRRHGQEEAQAPVIQEVLPIAVNNCDILQNVQEIKKWAVQNSNL